MAKHIRYSREFKEALVGKIVNRGNATVAEVCATAGIRPTTAYRWQVCAIIPSMKTSAKARKWSAHEKLNALCATQSGVDGETGAYLRQEGLHSHQVQEWREQALLALGPALRPSAAKDQRDQRIQQLEREILRKDKALAEASALLILQKKIDLIWGAEDPK